MPANSPAPASSVKILPANTPKLALRNCVKVALVSPVVGSFGLGTRTPVFTGTRAPDCGGTLSPKPLTAETLKKPPGQRPSLPVSTLSVYSALPQNSAPVS